MADPLEPSIEARYDAKLMSLGLIDEHTSEDQRRLAHLALEIKGIGMLWAVCDRSRPGLPYPYANEQALAALAELESYLERIIAADTVEKGS